jgi:hypothetical protein
MERTMGILRQRYLSHSIGFSPEKTKTEKKETIDDRIRQLESEVSEINGTVFATTSSAYGKG